MVVRVKCESEWNSIVVFSPVDKFFGRDDGPIDKEQQDSHICQRHCTFPLILRKNQSRHFKDDEV